MGRPTAGTCAFLTMADRTGFVIDDDLAIAPFADVGWRIATVPWTAAVEQLDVFDAVIVRSTWDYYRSRDRFLDVLDSIAVSRVPLFNPIEIMRWNISKTYLMDVEQRGVPIVPTIVLDRLEPGVISGLPDRLDCDEFVLKPVVGANAAGIFRLHRRDVAALALPAVHHFANTPCLAQPFVHAVEQGEFSLFYFNGEFSHAIRKVPALGDFRVQEEHGARIEPVVPTADLLSAGRIAMAVIEGLPLYARVDLVAASGGTGYWLMELELIEPSLYLRMDAVAPARLALAFVERMGSARNGQPRRDQTAPAQPSSA